MNLSLLKTRWHLGRRASKNVNKHVPWAPIGENSPYLVTLLRVLVSVSKEFGSIYVDGLWISLGVFCSDKVGT
jgi:hypothetical protein